MELTCAETAEAVAEFASRVLPQPQRCRVAAHLLGGCGRRRREVDGLTEIAARLLDLIPGTEPPLGLDRSVLAKVPRPQSARTAALSAVAAVILGALVAVSAAHVEPGSRRPATPAGVSAAIRAAHHRDDVSFIGDTLRPKGLPTRRGWPTTTYLATGDKVDRINLAGAVGPDKPVDFPEERR
jgi:hypothetical protein